MATATLNGQVIARSDATVVVEGNHYVPPHSVDRALLRDSDMTTRCPWKGTASYVDLVVGDEVHADAAWYYPDPRDAAKEIAGHLAFGRSATIEP